MPTLFIWQFAEVWDDGFDPATDPPYNELEQKRWDADQLVIDLTKSKSEETGTHTKGGDVD